MSQDVPGDQVVPSSEFGTKPPKPTGQFTPESAKTEERGEIDQEIQPMQYEVLRGGRWAYQFKRARSQYCINRAPKTVNSDLPVAAKQRLAHFEVCNAVRSVQVITWRPGANSAHQDNHHKPTCGQFPGVFSVWTFEIRVHR